MRFWGMKTAAVLLMGLFVAGPALADGILVFGGTGRLGSDIVKQLVNAGETEITVFARPTSDRARLDGLDVSYFVGDANNDDDIEAALKSAKFRIVINAMSNFRTTGVPTFFGDSMVSLTKWSLETGVKRLIFHSSIGVGDSSVVLRADLPEASRLRFQDKERAEATLRESGLDYVILRNYIIRPETEPATGLAFLSEDQLVTGSISRADLAILTVYCLDGNRCKNKILHASTADDWQPQRPE